MPPHDPASPHAHEGITARPVAELTSAQAAAAMEHCFQSYIVPVRVTAESWERRFRSEHLDPFASRVYMHEGRYAAILFITRRGRTSRVGGMAVAKELRGAGFGKRVMREAIADARARGDHALLLEVIEQNTTAVNLYASLGFRPVRRLVGWRWAPPAPAEGTADALREIDPLEVSRIMHRECEPDLPWMLAPETAAATTLPARAFALEDRAYAMVNPQAETVTLFTIVVPRAHRRQGWGTRMLHALAAEFPGRPWQVVAVSPEELAPEFFVGAGWERAPITQFDMRLDLLPED